MPVPQAEKLGYCGAGDAHFADASQFYEADGWYTVWFRVGATAGSSFPEKSAPA
jgi:hypothetical protein